jgi:hypothetical protein
MHSWILLVSALAHAFTKCSGVTDQLGTTTVDLNPLGMQLEGVSAVQITGGTAVAVVSVDKKGVETLHLDLCSQLGLDCPVAVKQAWKATLNYSIALTGTNATVELTVTDKSGATLSCINAEEAAQLEVFTPRDENAYAPETTCGGNCPSNDCSSCPCGTSSNRQNIQQWCSKFSSWNQAQCECIITHESGGNANAVNQNTGGSIDAGLWQINSQNWASCSSSKAPCDPNLNLACAIKVWQWGGNSFKLWSTCHICNAC